jgi:hypothetical protein
VSSCGLCSSCRAEEVCDKLIAPTYTDESMPSTLLPMVAMLALGICFSREAFAIDCRWRHSAVAPIHGSTIKPRSVDTPSTQAAYWRAADPKQLTACTLIPARDPFADPAAPYRANCLASSQKTEPIVNIPGQITVFTRQILGDKNATNLTDALRTVPGVTVGR